MAAIGWKYMGNNVYSVRIHVSKESSDGYTHVFGVGQHGETSGNSMYDVWVCEKMEDGGH